MAPAKADHNIVVHLDELLANRGMTLTELADAVDITIVNLSILKNGRARAIRFSTLYPHPSSLSASQANSFPTGARGRADKGGSVGLEHRSGHPPFLSVTRARNVGITVPTVAILPVKSFRLGKGRMADDLSGGARSSLGRAFAERTAALAVEAGLIPVLVAGDAEVAEWALFEGFPSIPDPAGGLDGAAAAGAEWAGEAASDWIVVHADLPLLTTYELEELVEVLSVPPALPSCLQPMVGPRRWGLPARWRSPMARAASIATLPAARKPRSSAEPACSMTSIPSPTWRRRLSASPWSMAQQADLIHHAYTVPKRIKTRR